MRLQKFLAMAGVASRRASERLIQGGRVTVNGKKATVLGTKINPYTDRVCVDQEQVYFADKKIYILLYKPAGYITSLSDPQNRSTVMKLLPDLEERVYPVGRLDKDTEGLLLLTNDGKLAYRLTHPKYEVKKKYLVETLGVPSLEGLKELQRGIHLEEGKTSSARIKLIKTNPGKNWARLEAEIHEGRKRQIRRMFDYIGYPVNRLKRSQFSSLTLKGLKRGEYRFLTDQEIKKLNSGVGLN